MTDIRDMTMRINELSMGMVRSAVIFTAMRADIFSLLESETSAFDIASALKWSPRGTRMLLDGLVALELVAKQNNRYRNTPLASTCLVPGRRGYQGHILLHQSNSWAAWGRLDDAVRTGTCLDCRHAERSDAELRAFILGMDDIAKFSAEELLNAVDLTSCRRLLDLGGGPATYSIAFVRAVPDSCATVLDDPKVIEIAREQIRAAGLEDRIMLKSGDMTTDAYGDGYDLVLISNIIHMFGPAANQSIVRKSYEAMAPGGMLIIKDFLTDNDRSGPPYSLLFALRMLLNTSEGDTYSFADVEQWTRAAGFASGKLVELTPQTRLWISSK